MTFDAHHNAIDPRRYPCVDMNRHGPILVAADHSPTAPTRMLLAQALAARLDRSLHVAHVEETDTRAERAAALIMSARSLAAEVVVVGRETRRLLSSVVDPAFARVMLRDVHTALLAAGDDQMTLPRHVVVATDFSPRSLCAARYALDFVAPDATVRLVHVGPHLHTTDADLDDPEAAARAFVTDQFAHTCRLLERADVRFETILLHGTALTRLLEYLDRESADLVVVSTAIGARTGGLWRGVRESAHHSIGMGVLRRASSPVLCIPDALAVVA